MSRMRLGATWRCRLRGQDDFKGRRGAVGGIWILLQLKLKLPRPWYYLAESRRSNKRNVQTGLRRNKRVTKGSFESRNSYKIRSVFNRALKRKPGGGLEWKDSILRFQFIFAWNNLSPIVRSYSNWEVAKRAWQISKFNFLENRQEDSQWKDSVTGFRFIFGTRNNPLFNYITYSTVICIGELASQIRISSAWSLKSTKCSNTGSWVVRRSRDFVIRILQSLHSSIRRHVEHEASALVGDCKIKEKRRSREGSANNSVSSTSSDL